ncbi:MAG: polyhydroxyalkanoic acid system family protein [Hydrogenophaga sp.]
MPRIHIHRQHPLGLPGARQLARQWAEQARTDFDMTVTCTEGAASDEVQFSRPGVSGTLTVGPEHFEMDAQLGFLLGAFKERIEAEIVKNLDRLLASHPAG